MLCSLLRVIQLYVASTALFSTSSTVYVDKNYQPVAVNYALVHPSSHINQTYTVVYQPEYMECFLKADMNPPQLILNATDGMDSSLLAPILVNHTMESPVCKKCKPCATRHGPPSYPQPYPLSYPQPYPPYHPQPYPPSTPATRPIVPSPTNAPYYPPLTEVSRSGTGSGATPTPTPTAAATTVTASTAVTKKPLHDDTYISCVKAPQHLHGKVWETAKFIDIAYHTQYARIDQCASACKEQDFQYYAMESGTRCWCAQSEPIASHMDDLFCSVCSDDSKRTCGNVNYGFMSVYKVNHPQLTLPRLEKTPTFDSKYVSMVLPAHHDWKPISKQVPIKEEEDDDDDEDEPMEEVMKERRKRFMRRRLFESLKNKYRKQMLRQRIQYRDNHSQQRTSQQRTSQQGTSQQHTK